MRGEDYAYRLTESQVLLSMVFKDVKKVPENSAGLRNYHRVSLKSPETQQSA